MATKPTTSEGILRAGHEDIMNKPVGHEHCGCMEISRKAVMEAGAIKDKETLRRVGEQNARAVMGPSEKELS